MHCMLCCFVWDTGVPVRSTIDFSYYCYTSLQTLLVEKRAPDVWFCRTNGKTCRFLYQGCFGCLVGGFQKCCLFAELGEVILEMSICSLITKDCYQNLIVHVVDVSTLWSPARPLLRPLRVGYHIMQSLAHCRAGFLCLFLFMSEIYNLILAPSLWGNWSEQSIFHLHSQTSKDNECPNLRLFYPRGYIGTKTNRLTK